MGHPVRLARIILGVALIAVFFAWLILRHQEPLSVWANSSTLLGWAFLGGAWLSCIGGVSLIATAWSSRDEQTPTARSIHQRRDRLPIPKDT